MANKKVTDTQLRTLKALMPGETYDETHRPRGSLERLRKKGFVSGSRQRGWYITQAGKDYLQNNITYKR